ncbi:MATE family efflux transporter [Maribellus sp. CM-23]|uniref:lipopolysaccharide biosynthesis protein n=1 Tax=Maribellus sp. CM-23 TaxID=2781026 RepID=UPI001F3F39D2|nr:MATE family efflux transporter [Maribellus sp. CM-23]MCE4566488.1 MATE family efflux transporter [Maribellus sp. CM-23]
MVINFKNPIVKNFGANVFGIVINLFNQIILVPFFLRYWGTDLYSDWLVISAFSTFLLMTDLGLNTVISNQFSLEYSRGNISMCTKLLLNNIFFIISIGIIILSSIIISARFVDISKFFDLHVLESDIALKIILALSLMVFLNMLNGSLNAIYRARSLASRGVIFDNLTRLIEVMILFTGIVAKWNILFIVWIYVIPKFVLLFLKYADAQKFFKFKIKFYNNLDLSLLKQFVKPSIFFMSFPVGNAIIIQGYTLLVNKFFGASDLVLFTTTRTMVNFIKTAMGSIATAVWPEFTLAFGKKDYSKVRKIHRLSVAISFTIAILISIFLIFFGEWIYTIWTNGAIVFDRKLMLAFILVLITNNFWYSSSVTLMATNNHLRLGLYYILTSILAIGIARSIVQFNSLIYLVLSLLIMDTILSIYTINASLKLTQDSFSRIYKDITQIIKAKYANCCSFNR